MFIKLTPRGGDRPEVYVNLNTVKVMMDDSLDDGFGTILVFDIHTTTEETELNGGQVGLAVIETIEEILGKSI